MIIVYFSAFVCQKLDGTVKIEWFTKGNQHFQKRLEEEVKKDIVKNIESVLAIVNSVAILDYLP